MSAIGSLRPTISGVAVVCCLHDREKRQIRTEQQIIALGREIGVEYDPKQHHIFECACCQNWFVNTGDEPRFCHVCRMPLVHAPAGPLAEPTGRL